MVVFPFFGEIIWIKLVDKVRRLFWMCVILQWTNVVSQNKAIMLQCLRHAHPHTPPHIYTHIHTKQPEQQTMSIYGGESVLVSPECEESGESLIFPKMQFKNWNHWILCWSLNFPNRDIQYINHRCNKEISIFFFVLLLLIHSWRFECSKKNESVCVA